MTDWRRLEHRIGACAPFTRRPVAVTFLDSAPEGVARFTGSQPSGCSFWRLAAEGRTFYTVPSDHFNCAVGSYTHSIDLSPERAAETTQTLEFMFRVNYIRPEEVAGIPRLPQTPAAVLYSALADTPVPPSVILFACRPASAMRLHEAAIRAGKPGALPPLGRPTCMALPAALAHGTVTSLGLYRQSRVYRPERRGPLRRHPRGGPARHCGCARGHHDRKCGADRLCAGSPRGALHGVTGAGALTRAAPRIGRLPS